MPSSSRALVLKKLRDCFPDPGVASDALHSLECYQGPSPDFTDLVHLAIIKLSQGKLWVLRDYVRIAKRDDPRDVIYPAQSPEIMAHGKEARQLIRRGLKLTTKPLSAAKEAAMRRRDLAQWKIWLESSGA